jgi:hypothetical protein
MNDHEGEQFFDLLRQIVDLPGMTWEEKRQQGRDEAAARGMDTQPTSPDGEHEVCGQPVGAGLTGYTGNFLDGRWKRADTACPLVGGNARRPR